MSGERTEKALARAEQALRRIDAARGRVAITLADQTRHNDRLRQAIAETLRDLDRMLATPDDGGAAA
ncbi:hypothetical protein ACFOON_11380 [Novosphingobium piscinae]|uniref:Uncharacterized protein n=1 Tax=Novosphingobium piscinae TaxID=1507448 RepID=A0A7X1FWB8_9SPHN|nr:hypothetical protein [Novosphingobium piscinae]MBC2668179.1 hypothetical protein [Novosphingobium piscinae]